MGAMKCKYCSNTMEIEEVDYYGTSYYCKCKDYKYEIKLENEITKLKEELKDKEEELKNHINNSEYNKKLQNLNSKIDKINSAYSFGKNV